MKRQRSNSTTSTPVKRQKKYDRGSYKKKAAVALTDELKYNDVAITTDASTTETVVALTTFAAGDTALTRDGNKIICKSLDFKIAMANEATTQCNTVRFVLVQSMQANNTAPTWFVGVAGTDVFDASTVTARRSVNTASIYKILMDKVIVINQGNSTSLQQAYLKKFIKLPDVVTTFISSSSGIPMTNAYYLMYVGSSAAGVVDVDVAGTARLRFIG